MRGPMGDEFELAGSRGDARVDLADRLFHEIDCGHPMASLIRNCDVELIEGRIEMVER